MAVLSVNKPLSALLYLLNCSNCYLWVNFFTFSYYYTRRHLIIMAVILNNLHTEIKLPFLRTSTNFQGPSTKNSRK